MNLMKKRWILLIVACTINLCAGSIYAWSVFAPPLAERLSLLTGEALTAGSLAAAFSLANAVGPIPMILGGAVNDRFGPRWVIASGGLLIGLGFFLAAGAETPLALILGYGLGFGLGLGLVYGSTINTTLKFFPDHRGLAGGLTTALYGLSSVILPPVALALISAEGIQYALMTLGSIFAVVIVSGGLFMQKCPEGFEEKFCSRAAAPVKPAREELSWRGMLRSKRFPPMVLLLLCGAIPGMMIISHCWSAARELAGLDAAAASGAVSGASPRSWGPSSSRFSDARSSRLPTASRHSGSGAAFSSWASPSAPSWGSTPALPLRNSARGAIPSTTASCSAAFRLRALPVRWR